MGSKTGTWNLSNLEDTALQTEIFFCMALIIKTILWKQSLFKNLSIPWFSVSSSKLWS